MIVLGMLFATDGGTAFGDEWSRDAAIAEFDALLGLRASTRDELARRQESLAAWAARVESTELDLADRGFLVALAKYLTRDAAGAALSLATFWDVHGAIPDARYRSLAPRIFLSGTTTLAAQKRFAEAERMLEFALVTNTDALSVYSIVARRLLSDAQVGADDAKDATTKSLNRLLHVALGDERLAPTQKQELLKRLYQTAGPTAAAPRVAANGPRPFVPFEATDLDGRKVAVADYRGKVLLVDFWATWCGPCIREMPNVVAAYREHHDKGFEILGVSLDNAGQQAKIRQTMERLGMTWRQAYDGKGWKTEVAELNNVRSIPSTFLLDRTGKVRFTNLRGKVLAEKVAELLAEETQS